MKSKNKLKIGAYITAYCDSKALNKCLQAIKSQSVQIDYVLIIDNSPNLLSINQENYKFPIKIKHYPKNIGIGAGIKEALQLAIQENYDFLWTFDQDSIPTPQCLETLLSTYDKLNQDNYKIGIIAPTPVDKHNNKIIQGVVFKKDIFIGYTPENTNLPYQCDAPITSGSLISIEAVKTIDLPREDLFIDGVDLDYGYRLKQKGFHNFIVPNAIMYHNFGNPKQVKFCNKDLTFQRYPELRHYYICRNHTYLETRFAEKYYKITCSLKRIKYLIFTIIKILLFDNDKKGLKIYACLLGTFHGFIGKLGKIWG